MAEQRAKQSNPFSTGGGGVNFEVYVQTYIAMHIVTGDSLPFLDALKPVKMKLQGHYDGYNTDDCIVFGENGEKALCQIKHSITVSENDSVFRAVITDAWNDYCNSDTFNKKTDRIILIVSGLSKTDTDHTKVLFEWAENCENEDEFTKKIATDGFSSKEKQKKYSAVKAQIESANGAGVSDYEIWDFFRHFNIQALELDNTKSPLFAAVSNSFSKAIGSSVSADTLYRYVAGYNQNAGTITREQLGQDLHIEEAGYSADDLTARENGNVVTHNWPKRFTTYIPVGPEVGLIGRSDIVDQVRTMLDSDKCVALVSGLGGIGKTAVMAQICNNIMTEGMKDTYVAWIACGESHIDDLLTLRQPLGVPKEHKREEAYDAVIRNLQDLQGTLYIFLDDMARVPDKVELGTYNALRPNVRIMITSRHEIKGIPHVDLKELEKDPAVDMFYDYYGKDTERKYAADAWEIINSDSVRSHTLLVELLAKAANAFFGSLADFRRRLEKEGFLKVSRRKFDSGRFDNKTIEESVTQLYEMSHLSEEQQRIMRLFSIFTPEKVIYGAIEEWAGFDADAVDGLVKRGWLVRAEKGFVIHQIIRDSLAGQVGVSLKIEDYGNLLDRIIDVDNYMPPELEYITVQERLVLAEDVVRYLEVRTNGALEKVNPAEEETRKLIDLACLYGNIALIYRKLSLYEKALKYNEKALFICENVLGCVCESSLPIYNNIAGIFRTQAKYEEALEKYIFVLDAYVTLFGKTSDLVAKSYNNIASVFDDVNDYSTALEYYLKAKSVAEQVLEPEHPERLSLYNNLAGVYHALHRDEESLKYYHSVLNARKKWIGEKNPDTATTYNNMAGVYESMGRYDKALKFYKKAFIIRMRVLGIWNSSVAMSYNNIAGLYQEQEKYGKSLLYYKIALSISKYVMGAEHPLTAAIYNNVATLFFEQDDYKKALKFYDKARAIREQVLGLYNIDTATVYCNMASSFNALGEYVKAKECLETAIPVFIEKLHEDDPEIQSLMELMESIQAHL